MIAQAQAKTRTELINKMNITKNMRWKKETREFEEQD